MRKLPAFVLLLLPLLWLSWCGPRPNPNIAESRVRMEDIVARVPASEREALGLFALAGLWRVSGNDRRFGGYSALVQGRAGGLLLLSDRNRVLEVNLPLRVGTASAPIQRAISLRRPDGRYVAFDVEAAVRDPQDGSLWLGLEDEWHAVQADTLTGRAHFVGVPEIRDWPRNGGAEAMARLPGGGWVMLCEACGTGRGGLHLGLLFEGHPGRSRGRQFGMIVPPGFDPVDAATLPDGRLLVLVRRFAFLPPHFEARIVLADLTKLDFARPLATQELARIDGRVLRENWEGMALVGDSLWLVTDANDSAFQQTWLMKLKFDPARLPAG